jgi:hypothetical protein
MSTYTTVLLVILAVMVIAYIARRRGRLSKDDVD